MTAPQPPKRLLSEAIYEQLMTDEEAPPSVRLEAAKAYDAIENGRPGTARPVNVDDVSSLDDDQLERLYHALMRRIEARRPGFFKAMMRDIVDQMLALQSTQASLPKPNRFKRGPLAGAGPEVPRWPPRPPAPPLAQPATVVRRRLQAELGPEAYAATVAPDFTLKTPAHELSAAANGAAEPPDLHNVTVMPGVARPFGLRYGTADTLDHTNDTASGNGVSLQMS